MLEREIGVQRKLHTCARVEGLEFEVGKLGLVLGAMLQLGDEAELLRGVDCGGGAESRERQEGEGKIEDTHRDGGGFCSGRKGGEVEGE